MILRRLSEHVREQNWTAIALDFLVVVLGVFIGLQAQQWNERRMDAARGQAYLHSLASDFDVITARLEDGQATFRISVESAELLLLALAVHNGESDAPMPSEDDLAGAAIGIGAGRVPSGPAATFEEMVSRGDLALLQNTELRNLLFEYAEFASIARDAWRTIRQEYVENRTAMGGLVQVDIGFEENGDTTTSPTAFDDQRFFSDPDIPGHLTMIQMVQLNNYQLLVTQLRIAEEIEALIAEELGETVTD
ncbi:hypothetical protein V0U79_00040 [Hyphobacterium sp. HN65]|uniref:Uncharacterized protein n=1 Tax=Hyphobacterium lacteum TaxID=3116575 RepID=A0ABU7LMB6_9PROT|nr:hypothetical protein [Hyphobacterium sp. HN65]MEE2524739.1 hypothetical protein [Hyphobacterium sp. HN65]